MGRPSIKTVAVLNEILERLSAGEPLAQICRDEHMPSVRVIYDWLEDDAEFSAAYARARVAGHDIIATQTMAIADEPPPLTAQGSTDSGAVQHAKLRIWTRMQLLAKWDPKRYGERVELAGSKDAPLTVQILRVGDDQGKGNG